MPVFPCRTSCRSEDGESETRWNASNAVKFHPGEGFRQDDHIQEWGGHWPGVGAVAVWGRPGDAPTILKADGGEGMPKSIAAQAIRDIMTASPITVYPDSSIRELKILFERYNVNAFPVVDDRGILRGIVSRLDVLRVFRPDTRRRLSGLFTLWAERVEDIMSRGVDAVEPADSVVTAVDLMIATGRRSLPVVERRPMDPVLVGMVSRTDLLPCLTLAEESPVDGIAHGPASASSSRGPRRLGRSQGGARRLTALARSAGERFLAMIARALYPHRGRRREEPRAGSAPAGAMGDDRLAWACTR